MTTAGPAARSQGTGVRVVGLGAASLAVVVGGVALVGVLALADGRAAASGAGVGALVVLVFFGFGALSVNLVAAWAPRASLLFALMTYTLQVLLLAAFLVWVAGSGLVPDRLDARWLGGTVIGATIVWMGALLVASLRSSAGTHGGETAG